MANDALVAPLMRVHLFQGLEPRQIAEIARTAERIVYRDGDVISEAGADADAAVLIVAGPVERVTGEAGISRPESVVPGSLVGEMAMLVEHVFGSTVVARGPVRALRLSRAALHGLILADRQLGQHFVAKISGRLHNVARELREVDDAFAVSLRHVEARRPAMSGSPLSLPPVAGSDLSPPSQATH